MFDPDTPVSDPDGHGTATASMIGALGRSTGIIAPVGPAQALFQDTFDAMHEA